MAVWSNNVTSRMVADADRFDGEYYKPEFLNIQKKLSKFKKLKNFVKEIIHPGEFSRRYSNNGFTVIRTQNVRPMSIEIDGNEIFIPSEKVTYLKKNIVVDGDILTTRTGANYGQTSLYTGERKDAIVTSHSLIVKVNNEIEPEFLSLYLNTYYGRKLIDQCMYGSSQPEISPKFLYKIPVPRFEIEEENRLSSDVRKVYELRSFSKSLYIQIQKIINKNIGLDELNIEKPIGYISSLSRIETSRRFDSEHFYPTFDQFIEKMPSSIKLIPLGSILNFCQRGKQPIYANMGLPVLNSKHIQTNRLIVTDNRMAISKKSGDPIICYGDVLINGTGRGTIGRAAPYLISEHNAIPDNHVTILRTKLLDPSFLSFYLNSLAGQMQVEKHQRGSSGQIELYPMDIRKFLVWDAPQTIQREISELHQKALECEKESSRLLEQAKRRVEELIEGAVQ